MSADNDSTTKCCGKCNRLLPVASFYKDEGKPVSPCKECRAAYEKLHREENREAIAARRKAWRAANPEKVAEGVRRWQEANPDKVREIKKRYAANNPEARLATVRRWRAKTVEQRRERDRRYYAANPGKGVAKYAAYRARRLNAPGDGWTEEDVAAVYKAQKGKCALCRVKLGDDFHRDHVVPLAKGGAHDRRNLQLVCGFCNRSKGARDPIDHARTLGLLL